jgi:hypothetical protein
MKRTILGNRILQRIPKDCKNKSKAVRNATALKSFKRSMLISFYDGLHGDACAAYG